MNSEKNIKNIIYISISLNYRCTITRYFDTMAHPKNARSKEIFEISYFKPFTVMKIYVFVYIIFLVIYLNKHNFVLQLFFCHKKKKSFSKNITIQINHSNNLFLTILYKKKKKLIKINLLICNNLLNPSNTNLCFRIYQNNEKCIYTFFFSIYEHLRQVQYKN